MTSAAASPATRLQVSLPMIGFVVVWPFARRPHRRGFFG
jgi:hypothetical protein